jgi:hypothetical protein
MIIHNFNAIYASAFEPKEDFLSTDCTDKISKEIEFAYLHLNFYLCPSVDEKI